MQKNEIFFNCEFDTEPNYIKIFNRNIDVKWIRHFDGISLQFLSSLANNLTNQNGKLYFFNNKANRKMIEKDCKIADGMITKYIKRCVDNKILIRTEYRGIYEVNSEFLVVNE